MLKRFLIRQLGANQRLRGAWARRSRVVREDDDLGTGAGIGGGGLEGALKVAGGVVAVGSALAGCGKKAVKGKQVESRPPSSAISQPSREKKAATTRLRCKFSEASSKRIKYQDTRYNGLPVAI